MLLCADAFTPEFGQTDVDWKLSVSPSTLGADWILGSGAV
jgi:hypothetical protein